MSEFKRIEIGNLKNFRDLGGYYSYKLQCLLPFNRMYRSDLPHSLTNEEIEFFRQQNIKKVIDLRAQSECMKKSCVFLRESDFDYKNLAIGVSKRPLNKEEKLELYKQFFLSYEAMKQILQEIATSRTGILFHCSSGKDRTGLLTALIYMLLEVANQDIISDYLQSTIYVFPQPQIQEELDCETIYKLLCWFIEKYNSAYEYMLVIGLTRGEIESVLDFWRL